MCIAVFNPPGIILKKWAFDNCWNNNKDGAGILYVEKGELKSFKRLSNKEKFYEHYIELRKANKGNMVLHFRRANYGEPTLENCHPFIYDNIGFVHNGTIHPCIPGKKSKLSDTRIFGTRILQHLRLLDIDNPVVKELVTNYVGYSRLILMDNKGKYSIINEELGEWNCRLWFSNDSYLKLRHPLDIDYGLCRTCRKRLFGKEEQTNKICYDCSLPKCAVQSNLTFRR